MSKAREWKLEEYGNQHNIGIEAHRVNGDGGWGDLMLPQPVHVIEKSAYDRLYQALQDIRLCSTEESVRKIAMSAHEDVDSP